MIVREATVNDVEALADVHVRTWRKAYQGKVPQQYLDQLDPRQRQEVWQRILQDPGPAITLVAEHKSQGVVGFIRVSPSRDADADSQLTGEVQAVYLLPEYWGHGAGQLLMAAGLRRLTEAGYRDSTLWVLATNNRARRFYEAGGWRPDGATKTDDSRGFSLFEVRYRRTVVDDLAGSQEQVLAGGNMGGAVRVGTTVRRTAGAWSPTIQRLLGHLRDQGLSWVPQPLGADHAGRDCVSYLPGHVPQDPLPSWIWADSVLVEATTRLRELHRASATFDASGAVWQLPDHRPAEVICHNDFAPYNMVFAAERLVGVIDWDTASPGPRVWDAAYLAYRLVPLTVPTNSDAITSTLADRADRLRLLCTTYGHGLQPAVVLTVAVQRLHELADFTLARAEAGQRDLYEHVDLYRRDARWIDLNADCLADAAQ
ncbi:GNAT family N-acetyltransferase [Actinoplanes subtropicus]|uniref:GNAT family N-acetyltransferase n=1 Tax=Actinoplanes subtropicus TaxID=543632 RepID=UPI0014701DCF|nr:GNAT family N-acetyltransferase [Actinoplanes subtropicus]